MTAKITQRDQEQEEDEDITDPEVIIVTPEEGRAMFDRAARKMMGISGEEFIRRWEAGEYDEIADTAGHRQIIDLALMIPFARQES